MRTYLQILLCGILMGVLFNSCKKDPSEFQDGYIEDLNNYPSPPVAQNVFFPTNGSIWKSWQMWTNGAPPPFTEYYVTISQVTVGSDTVINNISYKILVYNNYTREYISSSDSLSTDTVFTSGNASMLRIDSKNHRVYAYINNSDNLLYDFNLQVGDTLPDNYITRFTTSIVETIDSVKIGPFYQKKYTLNVDGAGNVAYLLYGIGNSHGLLEWIKSQSGIVSFCYNNQPHQFNIQYDNCPCKVIK